MTDKKWVQRGGGTFFKWDTPGQSLEGLWRGTREGKFGQLGTIETGTGNVTFPLHTALEMLMDGVAEASEIKIVYTGKQISRGGKEFKAFDVFTMGAAGADPDSDVPADPDNLPF